MNPKTKHQRELFERSPQMDARLLDEYHSRPSPPRASATCHAEGLGTATGVRCQSGYVRTREASCAGLNCGTVKAVGVTDRFGCYVNSQGNVWCWVGDAAASTNVPSPIAGLSNVTALTTGDRSLLVSVGGTSYSELTLDQTSLVFSLAAHPELSNLTSLGLGSAHVCALEASGTVLCSGSNSWGQLGDCGSSPVSLLEVPGIANATQVAATAVTNCSLLLDKSVDCWGGASFILGPYGSAACSSAQLIQGLPALEQIALGGDRGCGTTAAGAVWCWGSPIPCAMHGTCDRQDTVPRHVPLLDQAMELALEADATCGIIDGKIRCDIDAGQDCKPTGDAGARLCTSNAPIFVDRIGGLTSVSILATGATGRCAILKDGTLWCWSGNRQAATPISISGL